MAEVLRYVNTASTAGGDGTTNATAGANRAYASMNEWEADEQTNLVSAGDNHKVLCEGSTDDTTAVLVFGWTTGSSNDILVTTDSGASNGRHIGIPDSSKYRLELASGLPFGIREDYVTIDGIQLHTDQNTEAIEFIVMAGVAQISNCILRGRSANFQTALITVDSINSGGIVRIWNNLFYDNTGSENAALYLNDADVVVHIYNNTLKDCARGIRMGTVSQEYIKNNLIDCTDCYVGTFTDDDTFNDYNMSSDATTLGGTNDLASRTFTYVASGSDDFHLDSTDTGARGNGVSDPGSGLFSDDIDGDTRSAWDCGMDEFVAAGGVTNDYYYRMNQ